MFVTEESCANLPLRMTAGFPAPELGRSMGGQSLPCTGPSLWSGAAVEQYNLPIYCCYEFVPKQSIFHQPSAQAEDRKEMKNQKEKKIKGRKLIRNMGVLYQCQLRALDWCRMSPALSQERPSHYRQLLIDCLHLLSSSALGLCSALHRAQH